MKRFGLMAFLVACSSTPATNIGGDYSMQITNGSNGCNFTNYMVGSSAMDVAVNVTQNGDGVTATLTGALVADFFNTFIGSDEFSGTIDGDSLDLTLTGAKAYNSGNCAYTYNATLNGTYSNNSITGTVDYTTQTNNGSDCTGITGCTTTQDIAGSRPPQ